VTITVIRAITIWDYWSFEGQLERALRQILDIVVSVVGHDDSRSLLAIGYGPGQFSRMAHEAELQVGCWGRYLLTYYHWAMVIAADPELLFRELQARALYTGRSRERD
jgi:hypothetical protein